LPIADCRLPIFRYPTLFNITANRIDSLTR
jgi:hypothetical protein